MRQLTFIGRELPPYKELWIDSRFQWPLDELMATMEAQQHRRYLKTHLALDGLPYYPQVKYLVEGALVDEYAVHDPEKLRHTSDHGSLSVLTFFH